MSDKVAIPGLKECLINLQRSGNLGKVHALDLRTPFKPEAYTSFFVVPEGLPGDRFKIEMRAVVAIDKDATFVCDVNQDHSGVAWTFDHVNYGLVNPLEILRALEIFVIMNTLEKDYSPLKEELPYPNDSAWETASKRPIPGSNIHDLFEFLEGMVKAGVDHKGTSSLEKLFVNNWRKELEWHINRWGVFEHSLIKLSQGLSTPDLMRVLDERSDILYYLFDNKEVSNEEIKEVLRQCNKPRLTDRIYFQVPRDYKPGDSLKIMGNAISAIQEYERNFKPVVPEPDMINYDAAEPTIRWVNPLWLEWCEDNRISLDNALQKVYDAVVVSFPGRNVKVDLQRNTDTNIHYIVVTEKVRI